MNIEKVSFIDKTKLSGEFYFTSLVGQAMQRGLLGDADRERLEMGTLALLAKKTNDYTGGVSSSVRDSVAEDLMASNLYTVGLYLKSLPTPEDGVEALKSISLTDMYGYGRRIIATKLRTASTFRSAVVKGMIKTSNITYNETLIGGIAGFFKLYQPDYAAHDIIITADYPICNGTDNLVGIEFMLQYMEAIKLENDFCRHFTADAIHSTLRGYHKDYRLLVINIFWQILASAIGCAATGTESRELNQSEGRVAMLQGELLGHSLEEINGEVRRWYQLVSEELKIESPHLTRYIEKALPTIAFAVHNGVKLGKLKQYSLSPVKGNCLTDSTRQNRHTVVQYYVNNYNDKGTQ